MDPDFIAYYSDRGDLEPQSIDTSPFNTLIYAHAHVTYNGVIYPKNRKRDIDEEGYKKFTALKWSKDPRVQVLVSIGGMELNQGNFSCIANDTLKRATFCESALDFVKNYSFDGIDIDWDAPCINGGRPTDKEHFVILLRELRNTFGDKYKISVSVIPGTWYMEKCYDVPEIDKYVDYILLKAYDIRWTSTTHTAPYAPLRSPERNDDVASTLEAWLQYATCSKVYLGLSAFGITYTLTGTRSGMGVPAKGIGKVGKISKIPGLLQYNEILECQREGDWRIEWSDDFQVPYMVSGNQWVSYDNPRSIAMKAAYASSRGLAGFMLWTLNGDDPEGKYGEKYPLTKAAKRNF
ncbi:chitinase [Rhyzopertha dominica]|nr:chitinase [Rhyzopertha dominica]